MKSSAKLKWVSVVLVLFFSLALLHTVASNSPNYVIDGDSVYVNDNNAHLIVTPHTIYKSDWVYFNFTTHQYTGNLDLVWGFDTDYLKPVKIELYNPRWVNITRHYACREPNWFNYTLSPKHLWCWQDSSTPIFSDETNTTLTGYINKTTLVFGHDFDTVNMSSKTAYWNVQKKKHWTDVTDRFNTVNHEYGSMNKWYYVTDVPVTADQEYYARAFIKAPASLTQKEYKYWFAAKRSSDTLQEAISGGNFFYVDPFVNITFNYRYPVLSNATSPDYVISVNDTYGVQNNIIWTRNASLGETIYLLCEKSGCLTGARAIGNNTEDEKYWEYDNTSGGHGPSMVWDDDATAVYHFNSFTPIDAGRNGNDAESSRSSSKGVMEEAGVYGKGARMSSSEESYIEVPSSLINTATGTIEAWVNGTTWDAAYRTVAGPTGSFTNPDLLIFYFTSVDVVCYAPGNNKVTLNGSADPPAPDAWHHVAATWDSNNNLFYCYLNGEEVGAYKDSFDAPSVPNYTIGSWSSLDNTRAFDGYIDEFRFYNRTLTKQEILEHYQNGIPNNLTRLGAEEFEVDTTPPTWSDSRTNATNQTKTNENVHFNITLNDNNASGYYLFEFCDPSCDNDTAQSWVKGEKIEIVKNINSVKGQIVYWSWWFNDSAGNPNSTPQWSFTVVNSLPTQSDPILSSTSGKNLSTDNLTCSNQTTSDPDRDTVTNNFNWYKNNASFTVLNMPFETNEADYSGYGNNGTVYGNPQFTSGKYGNALDFDGTDDYILVLDSNSLDFDNKKTWQLWFKRDSTGAETLFDKGDSTYSNYMLEFLSDNRLKFSYSILPGTAYYSWEVNNENKFNKGAADYNQTYFNTTHNAVMLSGSNYSGDYKSRVFNDSERTLSFDTLSWNAETPGYEELSVEPDMAALWHFNENTGNTTYDETPNSNDGTVYGAVWTTGKFNSALDFDGVNDYVDMGDPNSLSFTQNDSQMTISLWMYSNSTSGTPVLVSKYDSKNSEIEYALFLDSPNRELNFYISDDGGTANTWKTSTPNNVYQVNEWQHIAVTLDVGTNTVKYYVNGTEYSSENDALTGITDMSNLGEPFRIGTIRDAAGSLVNFFNGTIDEAAIYNRTLSASEIQEIYQKGIGAVTNLSLSVRSCTSNDCSDKGTAWDITNLTSPPENISSLNDSKYFQFRADFSTNDTGYSPRLYNVTLDYSAEITETEANITSTSPINDTNWHMATVTFDDDTATNNFRLYLDTTLETQKTEHSLPNYKDNNLTVAKYFNGSIDELRIYNQALTPDQIQAHHSLEYSKIVSNETTGGDNWLCQVTPNDGEADGILLNSTGMDVLWGITFNVTDSYSGTGLNAVTISCDYSDFSQSGDNTNPYGPYGFPPGTYTCTFEEGAHFTKIITLNANNDKTVAVQMSESGKLSPEEHTWLEWLYNCWNDGDCWNLLERINQTTTQTWQRLTGTDRSVIIQEDVLSYTLNSTSNITINYTIEIPYKEGVPVNELLPIRLYFWFTDAERTSCYSQDKGTDTNRAENPYCLPLVAEILGPNNGSITFQVDLRPSLSAGTYNITRSIEIDPLGVWTQYGREDIGQIEIAEHNLESLISLSNENLIRNLGIVLVEAASDGEDINSEDNEDKIQLEEYSDETTQTDLLTGDQIIIIISIIAIVIIVLIIGQTIIKLKKK